MLSRVMESYWKYLFLVEGFLGDREKAIVWMETPNPLLGGQVPSTMIEVGREDKLFKFIYTQIEGNKL